MATAVRDTWAHEVATALIRALNNIVSGAAASLQLNQTAVGGNGGFSEGGIVGAAGDARSILTATNSAVSQNSFGGNSTATGGAVATPIDLPVTPATAEPQPGRLT